MSCDVTWEVGVVGWVYRLEAVVCGGAGCCVYVGVGGGDITIYTKQDQSVRQSKSLSHVFIFSRSTFPLVSWSARRANECTRFDTRQHVYLGRAREIREGANGCIN